MIKYLSIILVLLIVENSEAQQITTTSGGDAKGNSGSASYTIGQQDYISYYNVNSFVNQGVQQPFEFYCSSIAGNIIAPTAINVFSKTVPDVLVYTVGGTPSLFANGVFNLSANNGSNVVVKASKNNDITKANGVTALDIALVQSHILAKSFLNSPYKILAADVSGDGKVTALDIVYIKRLILGIDTSFPGKKLWAFVDSSYKFADSTNPFPFKDSISYTGLSASKSNQTFIGCKLGDVNWDWNPAVARPMINNINAVEFSYPSDALPGRTDGYVHIPVSVKNFRYMLGMQFTISYDPTLLQWQGLGNNPLGIETGTTHAAEGSISFLWVDPKNEIKTLEDGSILMELVFKTINPLNNVTLNLDGSVTAVVAYDKDYEAHNVVLKKTESIPSLRAESWTVAPNPTTDGVIHIQMNLKDNKTIVFRLLDNTGRVLLVKQIEGLKGSNNIVLKEGNIASGTYYLQAVGVERVKEIQIQ